jgi:hypothetical protein
MVNRDKVSYHCVLYLLNLSSNIFTFCVLINVRLCCCSLLINNQILLFSHQHRNYQKECAYLFDKDMQKNGVDHVIPIREAPILLLHKNIEVGVNFTFFGEAEMVKLRVCGR